MEMKEEQEKKEIIITQTRAIEIQNDALIERAGNDKASTPGLLKFGNLGFSKF